MAALLFSQERKKEGSGTGSRRAKLGKRRPTRNGFQSSSGGEARAESFLDGKSWQFLQFVALLSLVAYAAYQSHYIIFRASYFKLQNLIVTGNEDIPKEQIVMMSGLELGMPVFELDKNAVLRRLHLLPRVASASIEQRGPNEISIEVEEKEAVARIYKDGVPLEVDKHGAILGKARGESDKLPWILGSEVLPSGGGLGLRLDPRIVEGLVSWLPVLAESPLSDFSSISFPTRGKVVVMWHDIEIFLADEGVFKKHSAFVDDLLTLEKSRGQKLQYVDLRFNDIVARFHRADEEGR